MCLYEYLYIHRNYASKVRKLSQFVSALSLLPNSPQSLASAALQEGEESAQVVAMDIDSENSPLASQSQASADAVAIASEDVPELVDLGTGSDDDLGDRVEVLDETVASLLAQHRRTMLQLCSSPASASASSSTSAP